MGNGCLFCGGDASAHDHRAQCDGRQGALEALTYDPHTHARTTDPDTSHAAAQAVTDATQVRLRVYALHRDHPEGLTDEELVTLYARMYPVSPRLARGTQADESPRKRRCDLKVAGVLCDSGERRVLTSGRRGIVWKLAS